NVTPSELSSQFINSIVSDAVRPGDTYVHVDHFGAWRSTDCGMTFKKVSVGGMATGTGAWSAAIDRNPRRDPNTAPALYVTQGAGGPLGLWKSLDGGVHWNNVFTNNVFLEDGVTNISSDVGGDIAQVHVVDDLDPNHVIVCLHGYSGK